MFRVLLLQGMLALLTSVSSIPAYATPKAVLLFRHAEKPLGDEGTELSEIGWQRAKVLPNLFHRPELAAFGNPSELFAFKPKTDGTSSVRPLETLKFLSEKLGLPIDQNFRKKEFPAMAASILKDPTLDGKLAVVCWDRETLKKIAEALGVKDAPDYAADNFDRMWLIEFDLSGSATLKDLPEMLLPGDSVN